MSDDKDYPQPMKVENGIVKGNPYGEFPVDDRPKVSQAERFLSPEENADLTERLLGFTGDVLRADPDKRAEVVDQTYEQIISLYGENKHALTKFSDRLHVLNTVLGDLNYRLNPNPETVTNEH
jgi:hypothetical protein